MKTLFFLALICLSLSSLAQADEDQDYFAGEAHSEDTATPRLNQLLLREHRDLQRYDNETIKDLATISADEFSRALHILEHGKNLSEKARQDAYVFVAKTFYYLDFFQNPPTIKNPTVESLKRNSLKVITILGYLASLSNLVFGSNAMALYIGLHAAAANVFYAAHMHERFEPWLYTNFYKVFLRRLRKEHAWEVPLVGISRQIKFIQKRIESVTNRSLNKCEIVTMIPGLF